MRRAIPARADGRAAQMLYENEDFDNIFKAAWFVIVTLSTVGYGDISPVTPLGKFLTVPIIVAGLLFMAMPISIVGNNFTVIWEERQACLAPNPNRAQFQVPTRTPAPTQLQPHAPILSLAVPRCSSSSPRSALCSRLATSLPSTSSRSSRRWTCLVNPNPNPGARPSRSPDPSPDPDASPSASPNPSPNPHQATARSTCKSSAARWA